MNHNSDEKPSDKYPELGSFFDSIKDLRQRHLQLGERLVKADSGNIYPFDLVVLAVYKRSLDILDGILRLTDQWNFNSAAPLLRLQIDSLLKLVYLSVAENALEVTESFLKGEEFRHLKDPNRQPLTDATLRNHARSYYPWIDRVYEETSKLIHLTNKHFLLIIQSVNKSDRKFEGVVGEGNTNWSKAEIENFLAAVKITTESILRLSESWIE